jgi:hypothetical protein
MPARQHRDLEATLARFPKRRPALPAKLQRIYEKQYLQNRSGVTVAASLSQRLERWLHRQVAADAPGGATLELGAGTLNQLPFEPRTAPYDIVEPFTALFEHSPERGRIREVFADIGDAPSARRYARITSVAALEHICDLPFVLARSARLLEDGGVMRAAIPSEGGLVWALGWMLTTGLEFRLRYGLDYGDLMRHEHVNDAWEVELLVRALFEEVEIRSLGVGRQLSFYRFIAARRPRLTLAAEWEARFRPQPQEAAKAAV